MQELEGTKAAISKSTVEPPAVAFTNTLPEETTYILIPKNMPDDLISGFIEGYYALLCWNLYRSKTAPKLWYKCLIEFLTTLGFALAAARGQ